ncbi:hypothetical protein ACFV8Z_31370 [Streptomyces sp. NPDC059837]|uniref:hypothetical protein n=1 Tax=unclassified Streptomyces TaxID=2593676 RepID=UPI00225104E0|nr:hypothetical protein [Streptomyces sp. NBC_00268]MCX5190612.1 hypothetical protein [Streptomyces sp. NBC_00268]
MEADLRASPAGSNTAADHITTTKKVLAQLPKRYQRGSRQPPGHDGRAAAVAVVIAGFPILSWLVHRFEEAPVAGG